VITRDADETRSLAAAWAAELPADATVALHGDLGAGKTTWVQGLALGLGITEPVTSPTFNIYTIHHGMNWMLAHLDAYRLGSTEEAQDLLLEEYLVSPWCLAIEWPEKLPGWVPPDAWHLDMDIVPDGRHSIRLRRIN
jgi:tRNA threonylcarbamoyladenosine biosynthesis protein TsaE